jgi:hypothetical protein
MDWPPKHPAGIFDPAIASDLRHRAARSRVLFASISAINLPRVLISFDLGKIIESSGDRRPSENGRAHRRI